jgi:hypothetical protein
MELAQYTQQGTLVDHATALSPPAGVARSLPPRANVGNRTDSGRDGLANDEVLFARRGLLLLARAGSGDGNGSRTRHGRLYSHGGRHVGIG